MIAFQTAKTRFIHAFGNDPSAVSYSPGRIEFIGNHTDYNGGMVLGAALNLGVTIAIQARSDQKFVFASDQDPDLKVIVPMDSIEPLKGQDSWVNYPLGVLDVLIKKGMKVSHGFNLYVLSDLPTGAGLSSSAALELASLEAYLFIYNYSLSSSEKILVSQKAENDFVGVPCGILDQAVSCLGQVDQLVKIDCATTSFDTVDMPKGLKFCIFNTNQKHSLLDSFYSKRHGECRKALEILKSKNTTLENLAQANLGDLEAIENENVLKRARHVVTENMRVEATIQALAESDLDRIGNYLYASHRSSQIDFENSIDEIDTFVDLLKKTPEVIGARLTGGGFGGAAMALVSSDFTQESADKIVEDYRCRHPDSPKPNTIAVETGRGTSLLSD